MFPEFNKFKILQQNASKTYNNISNVVINKPAGKRKKKVDFIAKNKQKIREMSAEIK